MEEISQPRKAGLGILAILIWLVCFALALEDIYALKEIYFLIQVQNGVRVEQALNAAPMIVYALAFAYLIFIIASTEYHFKHFATPKSWRLFAWTFGIEALIYIIYLVL